MKHLYALAAYSSFALTLPLLCAPPAAAQEAVTPRQAIQNTLPVRVVADTPYKWGNAIYGGIEYATGLIWTPRHPEALFLRADGGGIWRLDRKSSAANPRWTPLMDNIGWKWANMTTTDSVAVDPDDTNTLYVSAGASRWGKPFDILKTTDGGKHWQRTNLKNGAGEDVVMEGNGPDKAAGERLACDPNKGSELWFGSRNDGLFHSVDGARTWQSVASFPSRGAKWTGIDFVTLDWQRGRTGQPTQVMYAGTHAGRASDAPDAPWVDGAVYKSENSGKTWARLRGGPGGHATPMRGRIAKDGTLYVTYVGDGKSEASGGGVWKVKDGQWTNITPLHKPDNYCGINPHPTDPNQILCSGTYDNSAIYYSKDAGATWTQYACPTGGGPGGTITLDFVPAWERGGNFHFPGNSADVAFDPLDSRIVYETDFSGPNRGTGVGTATMHFSLIGEGREQMTCADVVSPSAGAPLVSGVWDMGVFRHERLDAIPDRQVPLQTRAGGGNWGETVYQDGFQLDANPQHPDNLVVAGGWQWNQTGDAAYSTDNGRTLHEFATKPFKDAKFGRIAQGVDPQNVVWAPMGDNRCPVYYTKDNGATWQAGQGSPLGTIATDGPWSFYKLLAADRIAGGVFYLYDRRDGRFYRSDNGGANWQAVSLLPTQQGAHFDNHRIAANPYAARDVWAGIDARGLFHSADGGRTWTRLTGIEWVVNFAFGKGADAKTPALYLFGQIGGASRPKMQQDVDARLYRSDDLGRTWTRINDDQHALGTMAAGMTGDMQQSNRVYVTTSARGVFYGVPAPRRASTTMRTRPAATTTQTRRAVASAQATSDKKQGRLAQ